MKKHRRKNLKFTETLDSSKEIVYTSNCTRIFITTFIKYNPNWVIVFDKISNKEVENRFIY